MEITLDARVLKAAKIIGVLLCIVLAYWAITMIAQVLTPKPAEPPKYDFQAQLDFMRWSICQRTDAIQMYIQNPESNHPQVLKLKADIKIHDDMANELRKSGIAASNFTATNCR